MPLPAPPPFFPKNVPNTLGKRTHSMSEKFQWLSYSIVIYSPVSFRIPLFSFSFKRKAVIPAEGLQGIFTTYYSCTQFTYVFLYTKAIEELNCLLLHTKTHNQKDKWRHSLTPRNSAIPNSMAKQHSYALQSHCLRSQKELPHDLHGSGNPLY